MRVLFIVGSLKAGGTETYLLRFLQNSSRNFTATVFVTSGIRYEGDLFKEYIDCNVEVKFMRLGHTNFLLWFRYCFYLLYNRYDVICDFEGNFSGIRTYIAYITKHKKRVVFYRQTDDLIVKRLFGYSINKLMNDLVYKFATNILSNSLTAFNIFFANKIDTRFKVIYNGLDPKIFDDIKESKNEIRTKLQILDNSFVIGHTARYTNVKNHITILNVVSKLIKKYDNVFLLLAGREVQENLLTQVENLGIRNKVMFLGARSDVPRILRCLDVYYFPSLSEGQPNSLIEAMMSGVPFITSNIPSIIETIPSYTLDQCTDPLDVNSAFEKIEYIYLNGYDNSKLSKIKEDVIAKYNPMERFNEFEEALLR